MACCAATCLQRRTARDGGASRLLWRNPYQTITVLTLAGEEYQVHGVFRFGQRATSVLLPGFTVDVAAALAAGQ